HGHHNGEAQCPPQGFGAPVEEIVHTQRGNSTSRPSSTDSESERPRLPVIVDADLDLVNLRFEAECGARVRREAVTVVAEIEVIIFELGGPVRHDKSFEAA